MGARTKRRAKFDFRGRPFVWWVDNGYYLRISSLDKKLVIAYPLGTELNGPIPFQVIGPEFPGLESSPERPVWIVAPTVSGDLGCWVDRLLAWSFDATRQLEKSEPPRFIGKVVGDKG